MPPSGRHFSREIPPSADSAEEPVCLGPSGSFDQFLEFGLRCNGVLQGACAEQGPELFLDLPDRLERVRQVEPNNVTIKAGKHVGAGYRDTGNY